jgi:hypothetical protein
VIPKKRSWTLKTKYFVELASLYLVTVLLCGYAIHPQRHLVYHKTIALTRVQQTPSLPSTPKIVVVSGLPVRIVIPSESVDLPVIPGYYNSSNDTWTLSGYKAQFAMVSTLANDYGGNTFIYGHNNNFVFGPLRHVTPALGAQAVLYSSNGHIFSYTFQKVASVGPDDTTVLNYDGPPILTIQTCTGSLNEWRTMYTFAFEKILQ